MTNFLKKPASALIFLLAINLAAGLLTFRNYGMSWDEPLFYDYADSIRMAYSPQAFSPSFDFYTVFGKSPEDHKIYGPAYLLLARPFEQGVMLIPGMDMASAWHLINFLTFQIGLIAFYLLIRRWFDPWPAVVTTAFLAWQPVFWGHAFINPKDIPFMVFFLLTLVLGLDFVDSLSLPSRRHWGRLILSAIMLGLASATRVIGPLAGALVVVYFLLTGNWRHYPAILAYGIIAVMIMFVFWPYLWADPITRLLEVLKHMSNNPTELAVLFDGQIFRANDMPRRYLPQMLFMTLSEPAWPLFVLGCFFAARSFLSKKVDWRAPLIVLSLFVFMLAYVVFNRPAVYDGFRHFFFITPPIFVMTGFFFQWLWEKIRPVLWSAMVIILLLPGVFGILQLHPFEYTYYNQFAGGTGGVFRKFETDYWLTCYKEALDWSRDNLPGKTLHVQREFSLAEYYGEGLTLKDLGSESDNKIPKGEYLLFNTRADLDIRSVFRSLPVAKTFGRDKADFCIIKQKE